MLKGISPILSPDLIFALACMGHGDEIILADAHFPGHTVNDHVIRADGVRIAPLLDALMPLFELDSYVEAPVTMMAPVAGDVLDPAVEASYTAAIRPHVDGDVVVGRIDRFEFYERAKNAFVVVMTSETAKYGNIMLTKGVVAT